MRFRIKYCGKCDRFVLVEENKRRGKMNDPAEKPVFSKKDTERVWRNFYDIDEMLDDAARMKGEMPCPFCGGVMTGTDDCQVPLMLIQGRWE